MTTSTIPFAGTYTADPIHSTFGFQVRHQGIQLFRGSFDDVAVTGDTVKAASILAAVLEKHMQGRQFVAGDQVTVADFVTAYTLDWGNEAKLLGDFPQLVAYMERMYARPHAPPRIAAWFPLSPVASPTTCAESLSRALPRVQQCARPSRHSRLCGRPCRRHRPCPSPCRPP